MRILTGTIFSLMLIVGVFLFYTGGKGYRIPTTIRERWIRSLKLGFSIMLLMYGGIYFNDLLTQSVSALENQMSNVLIMVLVGGITTTIALFICITSHELRRKFERNLRSKKDSPDNDHL